MSSQPGSSQFFNEVLACLFKRDDRSTVKTWPCLHEVSERVLVHGNAS
jgi:hypothetical protein